MKIKVDGWNNFCRVFELPDKFSDGYCFGGSIPHIFKMVDWFNPVPSLGSPGVSKEEWIHKFGSLGSDMETEVEFDELSADIISFLQEKQYVQKGKKYIVIFDFGAASYFEGCK